MTRNKTIRWEPLPADQTKCNTLLPQLGKSWKRSQGDEHRPPQSIGKGMEQGNAASVAEPRAYTAEAEAVRRAK
jgi:hypothetical protein